ncbi:MAG: transcription termination factor NusA [Candidatus Paceibacteria bacterium]
MLDVKQLGFAISQIAEEKNIPREKVVEVIEAAVASAYKKDYGAKGQIITANMNEETGNFELFQHRTVVKVDKEGYIIPPEGEEEYDAEGNMKRYRFNPDKHISLSDAKAAYSDIENGQEVVEQLEPHEDFGRIAAQTAKQVIMQRIREIERSVIFEEYQDRIGEIVTGTVQRIERGIVFVDIGRVNALLLPSDQVDADNYSVGARYKFYIRDVEEGDRDPSVMVTRKSVDFVRELFRLEVPEIFSETILVKSVARVAGVRTKIAVEAQQEGLDPVGACVGQRGSRVQSIINELGGEKIDIIEYHADIETFIQRALSPAEITSMQINEEEQTAELVVPQDQLSLAIGGAGQNVRLASQLTGYNLDISGDEQTDEESEEEAPEETREEAQDADDEESQESSVQEEPAEEQT